MIEPLVGGVTGGLMRMLPEVIRAWSEQRDREHELAMARQYTQHVKTLGLKSAAMQEDVPAYDAAGLEGLHERYIDRATEKASRKYPIINALAAMVRPTVTWWLVSLYSVVRISGLMVGRWDYGESDLTLLASVLSFWFVGRVWDRMK